MITAAKKSESMDTVEINKTGLRLFRSIGMKKKEKYMRRFPDFSAIAPAKGSGLEEVFLREKESGYRAK